VGVICMDSRHGAAELLASLHQVQYVVCLSMFRTVFMGEHLMVIKYFLDIIQP
jgi:hypothetical protein